MLRPLAYALIVSFLAPATAAAQFGNITKKAKEKAAAEAAKAVGAKPAETSGALKFDNTMLELTTPVVNQLIAGLKVRANSRDAQGRSSADLRRQAGAMYTEAENLNRDRSDERFQYNNKAGEAKSCRDEYLQSAKDKAMQAAQNKMMAGGNLNMTFMTELGRVQGEMSQAINDGDTTKYKKLEADMYKMLGYDIKAETAKADAMCKMPQMPAWMARADSLNEASNRLYNQAREMEEKSNAAAIKASGLTAEQFAMGVERVTAYCAGGGGLWRFSTNEEAALKAATAQLKPLVG